MKKKMTKRRRKNRMTTQEIITLLYVDKKGNWNDMAKALKEKEKLEGTEEEKAKRVAEFAERFPHMVTITDKGYPKIFKKASKPPFVVAYDGDISILEKAKDHNIVAAETPMLKKSFDNHGISNVCFIKSDKEWESKVSFSVFTESGTKNHLEIYVSDKEVAYLSIIGLNASKFIATDGDPRLCSEMILLGIDMYAIPGKAGCYCNKLIKEGAILTDSWKDFVV